MPKSIAAPTLTLNRLQAAAALIPIIESGLSDNKISVERAALMVSYCEWAAQAKVVNDDERLLAQTILSSLSILKDRQAECGQLDSSRAVSCRSVAEGLERQLPRSANTCSRPFAAGRALEKWTFRNVLGNRRCAASSRSVRVDR